LVVVLLHDLEERRFQLPASRRLCRCLGSFHLLFRSELSSSSSNSLPVSSLL
jgi:hypothetical protein